MKFGLEGEKFLFDLKQNKPSEGVLQYIEALSEITPHTDSLGRITHEFVLSMVEIVTAPSPSPLEVIEEYLHSFELISSITQREYVTPVGLGSLPFKYLPRMIPKLKYLFQNSILDGRKSTSWIMDEKAPLTLAGNCAGIHIHSEIQTPIEDLYSTRELQDKYNLALMLTPMIAFSSSPFFFGVHEASSMRAYRYFNGIYRLFPVNGGLPPVMNSSTDVLKFNNIASQLWFEKGASIGLSEYHLAEQIKKTGANWNPVRWNKVWNTVEFRCLDSDRLDLDCSKFVWISSAMKRLDVKGENLICRPIMNKELNHSLIDKCFKVSDGEVFILDTPVIKELFQRATLVGIRDPFVSHYLERIADFSKHEIDAELKGIFEILENVLLNKMTTSEVMLNIFGVYEIEQSQAIRLIHKSLANEREKIRELIQLKSLSCATIQNKDLFEPKDLSYLKN